MRYYTLIEGIVIEVTDATVTVSICGTESNMYIDLPQTAIVAHGNYLKS